MTTSRSSCPCHVSRQSHIHTTSNRLWDPYDLPPLSNICYIDVSLISLLRISLKTAPSSKTRHFDLRDASFVSTDRFLPLNHCTTRTWGFSHQLLHAIFSRLFYAIILHLTISYLFMQLLRTATRTANFLESGMSCSHTAKIFTTEYHQTLQWLLTMTTWIQIAPSKIYSDLPADGGEFF